MAYVGNYMVPSYATFVCIHNFVYPNSSNSLFSLLYDFKKLKILILSYCCPVNFFCVTKKAEFHVWSSASFLFLCFQHKTFLKHGQKYTFYRTAGVYTGNKFA